MQDGIDLKKEQRVGMAAALAAYTMWGFLPHYWKLIQVVPAFEILAHRFVWSFVFLVGLMLASRKIPAFLEEVRGLLRQPARAAGVVVTAMLITVNWGTYIWAVNAAHVVECSLGYYINPLVCVLLGILVLKEKLSFWQTLSLVLAAAGVLVLTVNFGAFPWIALTLAFSFGLYGLIKKMVRLGSVTGITLETLLISPLMLVYLGSAHGSGVGAFGNVAPAVTGMLLGAGVVTATPLVLFARAANRLPLSAVGFLQYISPTLMLILGVFLYHEPFTRTHWLAFILIWIALTVYSCAHTKPLMALEARLRGAKGGEGTAGTVNPPETGHKSFGNGRSP